MIYQEQISLQNKNWFKVGGTARWYVEPTTAQEFQQAVLFAQEKKIAIFVLGEGANILISDDGFDGLVIRPQLKHISRLDHDHQHELVTAQAGVTCAALIDYCLAHNLGGLEEFSGIPGTIGGSVYINIHYFNFLLSQFLVSAEVVEKSTGTLQRVDNGWFSFGYDQSKLCQQEFYLVSATFKVKKITEIDAAYARGRHDEMIRYRSHRYPNERTCGSFFRNFHKEEVEHARSDKKLIYVAYYFDQLGFKGELQVNGARVSHQHANMLVTQEGAMAKDVVLLARTMQELVYKEFGIMPQPECQLVGFKEYPLL